MKYLIAVVSLSFVLGTQAAEAAQVRWHGEASITGKSGTCPDYDPTGNFMRARFRPGLGGDNGTNSEFSFFFDSFAQSFGLNNHLFDATFRTVDTMQIGDGFGPVDNVVKVKFVTQAPATLTFATNYITVTGEISGYDFMPLCTAKFTMKLLKKLN